MLVGNYHVPYLPAMIANGIELFNVFMFSPTLTLQSLFPFKLFCHAGVTDGGFANTTEVKAVERQHCTVSETLSN